MELSAFIRDIGIDKAAVLLDETPRTVKSWMYRERRPRPEKAPEIVRRTRGRVQFHEIYPLR